VEGDAKRVKRRNQISTVACRESVRLKCLPSSPGDGT
jgi:hypothetical protein